MKKKLIYMFLIICLGLIVSCSTNPSGSSEIETTLPYSEAETSSVESVESSAELVESSETITEKPTESTQHNPIFHMNCIEANGTLPDGEYIIFISNFDNDYSGATCSIEGYYSFSYNDLIGLENGDLVYVGDYEYTVNNINPDGYGYVGWLSSNNSGCVDLAINRLNDDFFYLISSEDEGIISYSIYTEYHLDFSEDIAIWDLYSDEKAQSEKNAPYGVAGHKFKDVQEFDKLLEEVREWHLDFRKQYPTYYEGYDFTNWCIDIHATVENGKIIYMRTHPNLHQDWIPYEVRMRYVEP